ncbi:putative receptor [Klebsiella pneumoniae]|nr:putative receptor [Klebsiella pneumoniae]
MPGGGYALPGLLVRLRLSVGPASNGAAGRWHQARSCVYTGWRLRLTRPTRPALTVCRPGKQRRRRAMASGTELRLCRVAATPYPAYSSGSDCLLARQATAPPGDGIRHGAAFMPGGGCALPGLLVRLRLSVGPASNGAARRWHQARSCFYAGWRLRLTRPTRPALTVCRPGKQRRRRAMASGTELLLYRVAAAPYPAYNPKSPLAQGLLKLPVLAASTSMRRSRKAGAARMDAG